MAKVLTKKEIRDDVIPVMLREAAVGSWLANRINRVDQAASAGNFEEQEMNLYAIRGYIAALVNTEYLNASQEDALLALIAQAKSPYAAYGLTYWQNHVGWCISRDKTEN